MDFLNEKELKEQAFNIATHEIGEIGENIKRKDET